MQILITNGMIVDGTGRIPYRGDILICDHLITEVSDYSKSSRDRSLHELVSAGDLVVDQLIDAEGAYVTPGFIDLHSHADLVYFLPAGLKPKIMQGVTTEVIGQCGLSVAPLKRAQQRGWRENLIIGNPPINWEWETMAEYLAALHKRGLENNLVPFVGHGVMRYNLTDKTTPLTFLERENLYDLTIQAFAEGALGLSLGLIYFPALFADQNELAILFKAAAESDRLVAVHLRNESTELIEALKEMIDLAEKFGAKLHISHLKAIGSLNWQKIDQALKLIEQHNLTFDHYPYTAGSTSLLTVLPPFLLRAGITNALKRLTDLQVRAQLAKIFAGQEILPPGEPWDNLIFLLGWDKIEIAEVGLTKNIGLIGQTLGQIAKLRGKTPLDATIDLLIEEQGKVRMIDFFFHEELIKKLLVHPAGMIGSDSLFGGKLHPRVFGTFPKIIDQYVFQQEVIPIEMAIAKMTSSAAKLLGLTDRGVIAPGYKADLAIFEQNFCSSATYQRPEIFSQGMKFLLINGEFKIFAGQYQKNFPGQILG